MTSAERAELEALRAENRKLKAITFRVSQKGGVSVYGLGRFPVTLYVEQWERLLGQADELAAFIEANRSRLATK